MRHQDSGSVSMELVISVFMRLPSLSRREVYASIGLLEVKNLAMGLGRVLGVADLFFVLDPPHVLRGAGSCGFGLGGWEDL